MQLLGTYFQCSSKYDANFNPDARQCYCGTRQGGRDCIYRSCDANQPGGLWFHDVGFYPPDPKRVHVGIWVVLKNVGFFGYRLYYGT